jgi:DNA polymerase V
MSEYILEDRLRVVMKKMEVTQAEMARRLGIAPESLGKYLADSSVKGKRNPEMLATKLSSIGISLDWYFAGKGTMLLDDASDKSTEESESEEALRSQARVIQLMFDRGMINLDRTARSQEMLPVAAPSAGLVSVPVFSHRVAAGKPVDSTCDVEESLDLPGHMIRHPGETYAVYATGDSMIGAGIEEGDLLIVDKGIEPKNKSIVIASINGEQTVKRLNVDKGDVSLAPENHKYPEIQITPEMDFRTLGVVVWVIRRTW